MPKDTTKSHHKHGSSSVEAASGSPKMSDVALRKKKNADAQAAFRARRANYITTLEETVTSLESVVLQLQDSCRESRAETSELRQENSRLRQQLRDQDKFLKSMSMRKSIPGGDSMGSHSSATSQVPMHGQSSRVAPSSTFVDQYGHASTSSMSNGSYGSANHGIAQDFSSQHTSAAAVSQAYATSDELPVDSASMGHRGAKYPGSYGYASAPGSHTRDGSWTSQSMDSNGASTAAGSSHSSTFPSDSSTLAGSTDLGYPLNRYTHNDPKAPSHSVDTAPYVFQANDSISPSDSPSSSTSLTSPFQYPYTGGADNGNRCEYESYPRVHANAATDVSMHGDVTSLAGSGGDASRYGLGLHRPTTSSEHSASPHPDPYRETQEDRTNLLNHPPHSAHPSRSPSPCGDPNLSGTLAVLKSQAFGALRRTRCRTKKNSEDMMNNAQVANDLLESRGLGPGGAMSSRRHRHGSLEDDNEL